MYPRMAGLIAVWILACGSSPPPDEAPTRPAADPLSELSLRNEIKSLHESNACEGPGESNSPSGENDECLRMADECARL